MALVTESISIGEIDRTLSTQVRAAFCQDAIEEYRLLMTAGEIFPPIHLFAEGGDGQSGYYVGDGWHRLFAAEQAGQSHIDAKVAKGTEWDAMVYAQSSNAIHGVRRSIEDRRNQIIVALADPIMCKWSQREIARRCNVSRFLVAAVIRDREGPIEDQWDTEEEEEETSPDTPLDPVDKLSEPPKLKLRTTDDPGKEKITPLSRKEARSGWGRVIRFIDHVGLADALESETLAISAALKEHWGGGL